MRGRCAGCREHVIFQSRPADAWSIEASSHAGQRIWEETHEHADAARNAADGTFPTFAHTAPAGADGTYPAPGHVFAGQIGDRNFKLDFNSNRSELTVTRMDGTIDTVRYTAKEIRPNVFMVYWTESNGTAVTHVEDFERGILHTNITFRDGRFVNLSGTFKQVQ
jgi:hypothetical protein